MTNVVISSELHELLAVALNNGDPFESAASLKAALVALRDQPLLLDLQGASALMGISTRTLRRMIDRGELSVIRGHGPTGKIWIERAEIDAFIARRREPADL